MTDTDRLAVAFTRQLIDWLTPEEMTGLRRDSLTDPENTCSSHDYCDSNQAMLNAFETVYGREVWFPSDAEDGRCTEAEADADMALMDAAWEKARASGWTVPEEREAIQ